MFSTLVNISSLSFVSLAEISFVLVRISKNSKVSRNILCFSEISQLQKATEKRTDTKRLQNKIDELENKKRRLIDYALDGMLTKEDLKSQKEWYNEQLESLNRQLTESIHQDKLNNRETLSMEKYIKALDEIMDMDCNNDLVYKEVLDRMNIHKGNVVDVWLKCIPIGIRLKIKATGKGKFFKTKILETTFIEK